jgi:hypothetical protein
LTTNGLLPYKFVCPPLISAAATAAATVIGSYELPGGMCNGIGDGIGTYQYIPPSEEVPTVSG